MPRVISHGLGKGLCTSPDVIAKIPWKGARAIYRTVINALTIPDSPFTTLHFVAQIGSVSLVFTRLRHLHRSTCPHCVHGLAPVLTPQRGCRCSRRHGQSRRRCFVASFFASTVPLPGLPLYAVLLLKNWNPVQPIYLTSPINAHQGLRSHQPCKVVKRLDLLRAAPELEQGDLTITNYLRFEVH